ncbi:hypothetical protein WN944_023925 [Citrus x changshan-huyou]|uniref:Uncharacterized protein n=1 Tax=Citrus x changshan-huyou TaxID=2935761 RepID=A0AAP0LRG6_9ROSI
MDLYGDVSDQKGVVGSEGIARRDTNARSSVSHDNLSRSQCHGDLSRSQCHGDLSRSHCHGDLSRSHGHGDLSRWHSHGDLSQSHGHIHLSRSTAARHLSWSQPLMVMPLRMQPLKHDHLTVSLVCRQPPQLVIFSLRRSSHRHQSSLMPHSRYFSHSRHSKPPAISVSSC